MIGIFDSGSGGLTVLKEIRKVRPMADIIYLGDIRNAPYGTKTREELGALTVTLVEKLLTEGATRIVSACNSVSSSIVLPMFSILNISPVDMVEMVGPTVKAMRNEERPILLVATKATIESGIYQNNFRSVGKKISTMAMPELAGAIEFGVSDDEIETIIEKYLGKVDVGGILLLGCTHYPLVQDIFEKVIRKTGKKMEIYDPAVAVAKSVEGWDEKGEGKMKFIITKDSSWFRKRVKDMFGDQIIISYNA